METQETTATLGGVEKQDNNIVVMGAPKPEPKQKENNGGEEAFKGKAELLDKKPEVNGLEKQETAKPTTKEENIDLAKKPEAENKPTEDKSEKPKAEKLEIDFGKTSKTETQKPETQKKEQETVSVNEDSVVKFLKENGFQNIQNLNDLASKVTLPESVEKFKNFHEETGRGIKDFYNLQKDWNSETSESRIKEYLSMKYPDLDDDQIKTQFDVVNVTEDDEEVLTPRELARAKAEFDKMDSDAVRFLNEKSKEYKTPLESKVPESKPPTEEQVNDAHKDYWKQRDKSLNEFKEVSFNIKDLGEIKIAIDEEDRSAISKITHTADTLVGRWKDDKNVVQTNNLVVDTAWGIDSIRNKMLSSIVEQVNALTLDKFSKQNRNVDLDDLNTKGKQKTENNGFMVKLEDKNKEPNNPKFGTPVFKTRN